MSSPARCLNPLKSILVEPASHRTNNQARDCGAEDLR